MTQTTNETESAQATSTVVKELAPAPSIKSALRKLHGLPGCLLMESAMLIEQKSDQPIGRYSFLMADPFETIIVENEESPTPATLVVEQLRDALTKYRTPNIADLPPMQGGVAGLFSYDLNRSIENISPPVHDEFRLPVVVTGVYDTVIAWDHEQDRAWIISQGFPETLPAARKDRAEKRAKYFETILNFEELNLSKQKSPSSAQDAGDREPNRLPIDALAPCSDVDGPEGLKSDFSREGYIAAVQKCIDYIYAGDVFQINLSQRLLHKSNCPSLELYERLRVCNPATFSGYFDVSKISGSDAQIVSASPERFFSVRDNMVETRPIKGTRRRTGRPLVDIQARKELVASEKDRAENTMIVDLMRNDLSRVCADDSICVTQLCELEEYQSVFHLVSAVQGRLKEECDLADLLFAVFPGGSIVGAPKIRAMEIISELEPTSRGAYCGALGYLGFNGNADLNILIRTITASQGWWQIPVGGGIVSQSNPIREYEETWTKAAGMLRAVSS